MNLLSDIITYIRRIIKSPSNASITDNLLIDYINRFWIMDVDARIQLFDLKTKYAFQTAPGVDRYNMPLYSVQSETPSNPAAQDIGMYPVYQGFLAPMYVNGVPVSFETQKDYFVSNWFNVVQSMPIVATGNGSSGPYTFTFPISPVNATPLNPPIQAILRGHIDINGIIAYGNATGLHEDPPFVTTLNTGTIPSTSISSAVYITSFDEYGNSVVVQDSGQFLKINTANYANIGLLMSPGDAPYGYSALPTGYSTTFVITGITQAAQAVVTATTTYQVGQTVQISSVVGMNELNGNTYTIVAVSATTITLNVDSTSFTAYVSGGVVSSTNNVINYLTGEVQNLYFPVAIPAGVNINAQCYFYQAGLPRAALYYNNTLTLRSPPDRQYLVELDAYLTPAAFFDTTAAIPFAYMAEYIARGAARKILSDTGDWEQYQAYEPIFKEQENLVHIRSQRQWTSTRTHTIYSMGLNQGQSGFNSIAGTTY